MYYLILIADNQRALQGHLGEQVNKRLWNVLDRQRMVLIFTH